MMELTDSGRARPKASRRHRIRQPLGLLKPRNVSRTAAAAAASNRSLVGGRCRQIRLAAPCTDDRCAPQSLRGGNDELPLPLAAGQVTVGPPREVSAPPPEEKASGRASPSLDVWNRVLCQCAGALRYTA